MAREKCAGKGQQISNNPTDLDETVQQLSVAPLPPCPLRHCHPVAAAVDTKSIVINLKHRTNLTQVFHCAICKHVM
jgi:hypothetical protein